MRRLAARLLPVGAAAEPRALFVAQLPALAACVKQATDRATGGSVVVTFVDAAEADMVGTERPLRPSGCNFV